MLLNGNKLKLLRFPFSFFENPIQRKLELFCVYVSVCFENKFKQRTQTFFAYRVLFILTKQTNQMNKNQQQKVDCVETGKLSDMWVVHRKDWMLYIFLHSLISICLIWATFCCNCVNFIHGKWLNSIWGDFQLQLRYHLIKESI